MKRSRAVRSREKYGGAAEKRRRCRVKDREEIQTERGGGVECKSWSRYKAEEVQGKKGEGVA